MQVLVNEFEYSAWKSLCEACLVQMFNRRRSGEIERLLISDYNNRESVDEHVNPDLYANLSEKSREYARKYVRLTIRGKLGRTVPVLLDNILVQWIDTILKYRSDAGIKPNNEFVFGLPVCNKLAKSYFRACPLIRKFSKECGATMPTTLRSTTLRKHIATYTTMLNIKENQISDLANFMGHNKQIHKDIHRVPAPVKDVTDVSQLLQAAMGIDENEVDGDSEDDEDDPPMIQPNNSEIMLSRERSTNEMYSDTSSNHPEDNADHSASSNTSKKRSSKLNIFCDDKNVQFFNRR
ncbi:hypothetical protein KPH14_010763 [Odynerus spinipes]|uniref:Uncharacterized protein n=1 Tax=Odynerus spinipes TaxID=1348599 RepID=A0AAD9RIS2_9HYME|nr:hypothetical protein KPH14_010763 [Odynerus spinipes]